METTQAKFDCIKRENPMGEAREDAFFRVYVCFTCACCETPVTIYPAALYNMVKSVNKLKEHNRNNERKL